MQGDGAERSSAMFILPEQNESDIERSVARCWQILPGRAKHCIEQEARCRGSNSRMMLESERPDRL